MKMTTSTLDIDPAADRRVLFAAADLPIPVFDGKRTPTHDSMDWDAKIGVLVHQVIGRLSPTIRSLTVEQQRTVVADTVASVVASRSLGRLGKARARATGMVMGYVTRFMPPVETEFLGTELVAGDGRVDLAWSLPGVGVWFDEIKTWRHHRPGLDADTWDQVHRYIAAGRDVFGDDFAGIRVLTLGDVTGSISVDRFGTVEDLAGSPLAPSRLVVRSAA